MKHDIQKYKYTAIKGKNKMKKFSHVFRFTPRSLVISGSYCQITTARVVLQLYTCSLKTPFAIEN